MSRRWVFDASPLIVLAKIEQSALIPKLCDTPVIPEAVADEVQRGPASDPGRQWLDAEAESWIRETAVLPRRVQPGLGRGERAVLAYALQHEGCTVILDERAARRHARSRSLKVRGTLGLLLLGKSEGHLGAVRPHLDALRHVGFRVSRALRDDGRAPTGAPTVHTVRMNVSATF